MDKIKKISLENTALPTLAFCRKTDKLSTELDQETIILDMDSGIYSQLNPVASTIWQLLIQPVNYDTIVQKITAEYDTTEAKCKQEIIDFLIALAEHNLITVTDA